MSNVSHYELAQRVGLHPVTCPSCGTKIKTDRVLDAFFRAVAQALVAGERVRILGFGAFQVFKTKARTITSPIVGGEMDVDAKNYAKFTSSKELKMTLNGGTGTKR